VAAIWLIQKKNIDEPLYKADLIRNGKAKNLRMRKLQKEAHFIISRKIYFIIISNN